METLLELNDKKMKKTKSHKGLYVLANAAYDVIYGQEERQEINEIVEMVGPQITGEQLNASPEILNDVEVIFSGWGAPAFNEKLLDAAPNLKAIFYAAGTIKILADKGQIFDRGVRVTSSAPANAIPVAEFCLSQILFSLKLGWHFTQQIKIAQAWMSLEDRHPVPGCYKSTIGIISLGAISLKLIELLKPFDLNILVSSSYMKPEAAKELGVELASIEEIFKKSDVVSLHTPDHKEGIITGEHFRSMKKRATFLNTARGICIKQDEMVEALKERTDIIALLDVTEPEPPIPGSELLCTPNIITFPHIAGSMNNECRRMARYAIDDYKRFCNGEKMEYEVTKKQWEYIA